MGYAGIPFLQQDLTSVKRINKRLTESRRLREAGVKGMKWGQHINALKSQLGKHGDKVDKHLNHAIASLSKDNLYKGMNHMAMAEHAAGGAYGSLVPKPVWKSLERAYARRAAVS